MTCTLYGITSISYFNNYVVVAPYVENLTGGTDYVDDAILTYVQNGSIK